MHIPENYLSPSTCAVMTAAMIPVWAHSIRKVKNELPKEKISMIGVGAAFSFVAMMFNVPLPGGTTKRRLLAAGLGSFAGINAAAFCAAVEFGIQPALFHDAAGQALYCPYGLSISIPAMMIGHLTIFGLAEVIFTAGVLAFILRTSPSMVLNTSKDTGERKPLYLLLTTLVILVPLGLLADGTAWGEWGADEIAMDASAGSALGYTPAGMTSGFELSTLFPDYTVSGMPDVLGYIVSAVIGVSLLIIVFRLMGGAKKGPVYSR